MKLSSKLITFTILLIIAFSSFTTILALKEVTSTEYKLLQHLTQNYSKHVRPVKYWNQTQDVFVNIDLKKISNVGEYHQTILIYVRLELNWTDINLSWEPSNFSDIKSIVLPADKIWIPDLHLFNSAAENDRIYPLNVQVSSDGTVKSYPINQLYAHCDFDFSDFPYDTQKCDFLIGNVVEKSKVRIYLTTTVNESRLGKNSEWSFVKLRDRHEFELSVPGTMNKQDWFSSDWSVSMFTLTIKRSAKFYENLFIWPLMFILIIQSCVFILPPTCIERASMGVLLLLTLVIMSLMLDSYTPKNSVSLSVIDNLIGFSMFMVTWSTFVSTLIIGLDKDTFTYRPIPTRLKNILLKYIGKITFKYGTLNKILNKNQNEHEDELETVDTNELLQSSKLPVSDGQTTTSNVSIENLDLNQAKTLLVLINNQLTMFRSRLKEKDNMEENKKDWLIIGYVLDRFCLIIFYVFMFFGLLFIYF
ncbi:unnamed protein product [Brachionus calyciflorus]|uniref:Uncharacterized protein n=1 Tax=Brachionus calyciflorus TaxID=104777 RepID=A0A813NK20_9BILA|nr:unnamed protein product [Brachionus calyciflorus]